MTNRNSIIPRIDVISNIKYWDIDSKIYKYQSIVIKTKSFVNGYKKTKKFNK